MLAGFRCVDFVTIFDDDDVEGLLRALRPDVHCKGTDYAPESLFGKTICVPGTITEHKGKPEIKVTNPSQIRLMSD